LNLRLDRINLGVDLGNRPWWGVPVEVASERDLVPDLGLGLVNPCVSDVGAYLAVHERLDVLSQGDVLVVAEVGVRKGLSLSVADDRCVGVRL